MADYIPTTDADFNTWQDNFVTYVNSNLAALGLTAADLTPVTAAQSQWQTAYAANVAAQAAAQGASQTKTAARRDYENLVRPLVRRLQGQATIDDKHRAGMGIRVRTVARTPVGSPPMRPVATIDTSQRLRHTINFSDETTPSRRAKPDGVLGCEIWVKVGDPAPVDPQDLHFLATDTATPYVAQYDGAAAGKVAYYWLRWVSRKGETGPWSQMVSATITG
jgi:hypothetical protein